MWTQNAYGFGAAWSVDQCDAIDMDYDANADACVPPPHPADPVQSGGSSGSGGSASAPAPPDQTSTDAGMTGALPWLLGGAVALGIFYYVVVK